jgi:endonuclease/exonuclease/phosphatase family metal-dependent hydrolase
MTFNVRYDNPDDSLNSWLNRAKFICNFLNDEKPDLLGMQEVLVHQYEYLDSLLTGYSSVGVGRDDGAREGEMNPVFFRKDRFDLIRTRTFWLSDTPEVAGTKAWGANLPRIVTWVELSEKTTSEHFYFFNTHFAIMILILQEFEFRAVVTKWIVLHPDFPVYHYRRFEHGYFKQRL